MHVWNTQCSPIFLFNIWIAQFWNGFLDYII